MKDLTIEERSLLDDLRSDYQGYSGRLKVFPTEYEIAQKLINKGYITLDPDSDDYVWFVSLADAHKPDKLNINGAVISNFIQSEKNVTIELGDGRTISIDIKRTRDQDEWGDIIKYVFFVTVN